MPSPELPLAPDAIRVDGHERQDLSAGWRVAACAPDACAAPGEAEGLAWVPASVPGTAAGALRDAGLWDFDDGRDFDASDWWFRTEFEAAPAADDELVLLRLDGVATVHEVFLNGERIGGGESMFAGASIDVGDLLRDGENDLAIRCLSLEEQLGGRRKPRARWRARLADNRLRFFRTMLLGRCPGFAPGPAAVGPWRPVWIERRRVLAVSGLELRTRCEGADGVLSVAATVRGMGGFEISAADLVVSGAGEAEGALAVTAGVDGAVELRGEVRVLSAPRWWPHTHGEPALHTVRLRVAGGGGEVGVDAGHVGFRELAAGPTADHEIERDGLDLHVNRVAVFARGAVWTPLDFVGMAPGEAELRTALEQVREAGMNMLRIPGTSAYESPRFYDLCDELGILVWQDFAFANFDYPIADEGFRAAVAEETVSTLATLAGRPSIAVLCGNNEVEQQAAMLGFEPALGRNELFRELLPAAIERAGVGVPYLPSAPCGGEMPFRTNRGVSNYFGVGGYLRSLSDARLADLRFAAECLAFANVPDPVGIEAIAPGAVDLFVHEPRWKAGVPRDAGAGWDFDDVRDHYLNLLFEVDPSQLRRVEPERYLELSRAVSGEVMAAVFGEWRRAGSRCAGGLILWLRDLRPGAGWGLLDQSGAPKAAWHHLRRAMSPQAVWMTDEGLDGVGVHVANDRAETLAATLRVATYQDGKRRMAEVATPIEIGPRETAGFDLEGLLGQFVDASWAYRFGPSTQDVIVAGLERGGKVPELISQSFFLPAGRPRGVSDPQALGLETEARADATGVTLTLHSEQFVYGLRLAADGLRPDDDAFSLEPGVARTVHLSGPEPESIRLTALNMLGSVVVPISGRA